MGTEDYVECSNCGHALEVHGTHGCDADECPCRDRWTVKEIQAARKADGLPATFKRYNF